MDYPVIDIKRTGEKIKKNIKTSGHTVNDVAEYLGATRSLVYRYIRGDVLPSIDRLVALSVYLNVPMEDILAVS